MPGAPKQTIPQAVGMLPTVVVSQVKSGAIPDAAANDCEPTIQVTPAPWFVTFPGTTRSTVAVVPVQLNAVMREFATAFWKLAVMRISTYCTVGFAPTPDITSLILAMWKTARAGGGWITTSNTVSMMTQRHTASPSKEARGSRRRAFDVNRTLVREGTEVTVPASLSECRRNTSTSGRLGFDRRGGVPPPGVFLLCRASRAGARPFTTL